MRVKDKHRRAYAKKGSRNNCGDWLALQLEGRLTNKRGQFDAGAMLLLLAHNGVTIDDKAKWYKLKEEKKPGWQGRFRMSTRTLLEGQLLRTGILRWPNSKPVKLPDEEMARLRAKYPRIAAE